MNLTKAAMIARRLAEDALLAEDERVALIKLAKAAETTEPMEEKYKQSLPYYSFTSLEKVPHTRKSYDGREYNVIDYLSRRFFNLDEARRFAKLYGGQIHKMIPSYGLSSSYTKNEETGKYETVTEEYGITGASSDSSFGVKGVEIYASLVDKE